MSQFPLFPPQIPPMIGRDRLYKKMVDGLTKPTPQSLSLVGPRFSGKSVVLSAIAKDPKILDAYCCVVEWDLGHQIPQSDEEFIAAMRKKISAALAGKNDDISKHLAQEAAGYDELLESFELLETDKQRVLMLWDGVDPTIGSGKLTRNLWDNLLALGRKDSLVLVTTSRRKLQELIRDAQSVTSEFWLLFEPVKLDPMKEEDVIAFSEKLSDYSFQAGAVKEIINWTGGIAPLVVWLFNRICDAESAGAIAQNSVNQAAQNPDDRCAGILDNLWSDCTATTADLYRSIAEQGQSNFSEFPKQERTALVDMGLVIQDGGSAKSACRLVQSHISGSTPEFGAMARMFGTADSYGKNIRGILERRFSQIKRFDETLFRMVERAIEDIPDHVSVCLGNLTKIEERALDLVWKKETDAEGNLKPEVVSEWTLKGAYQEHRLVKEMREADEGGKPRAWEVSADRTKQLGLLQLLTGSHHVYKKALAQVASKDTYVLLNAIHSFRNRTEHDDGQDIALGVAVSAVMLCIELLACLEREAH